MNKFDRHKRTHTRYSRFKNRIIKVNNKKNIDESKEDVLEQTSTLNIEDVNQLETETNLVDENLKMGGARRASRRRTATC